MSTETAREPLSEDFDPSAFLNWPSGSAPAFLLSSDPRNRLLTAMALAVSLRGYDKTTVADVVRIAHASRRTFYEHFDDRAECFLALGDELTEYLLTLVAQTAAAGSGDWREQLNVALDTYLEAVAANPGLTRSFLLELFGMGARGIAHRRTAVWRWAQQLHDLVASYRLAHPELNPISQETAVAIAGGIWELSLLAAEEGRQHELRDIRRIAAQLIADVLTAPRQGER